MNIPNKYNGSWNISYINQPGFPWWQQIKYPIKLFIETNSIIMVDQYGYKCLISTFEYDNQLDILVFSHCGIGKKSDKAFDIIHVVKVDSEGRLIGEVRSYKTLFKWKSKLKKNIQQ